MIAEPDNNVLRYLRQIDAKVDRVTADLAELKIRVGRVENTLVQQQEHLAELSNRMGRFDTRLDRIEMRLDHIEVRLKLAGT